LNKKSTLFLEFIFLARMIVDKKGQVQAKKGQVVCPDFSYHTGQNRQKGRKGQQF